MSDSVRTILAFGLLGLVTACAQPAENEFVVVEPGSLTTEPAHTGKY